MNDHISLLVSQQMLRCVDDNHLPETIVYLRNSSEVSEGAGALEKVLIDVFKSQEQQSIAKQKQKDPEVENPHVKNHEDEMWRYQLRFENMLLV